MQKDNCVTAGNITEEVRTESEYQVLSQKLTALPSPQKMRWKIRIFHTHGKCYLPKEHPFLLSSQKPNAWSHQGDNEGSKAHHIKARGARQFLNLCHVIHPHDFPFHSFQKHPENHSSCRLLQQPQKKDRLSHKCKFVFRVYFFLLARIKAGAMAQQELFSTAMGDTLITAMAPEWKYPLGNAQGTKNTSGLGRRGSPSGCRHGATRQGCTRECCAKICLWQGAYSRYQTPLRAGASPEHPTMRQPPQQGHS